MSFVCLVLFFVCLVLSFVCRAGFNGQWFVMAEVCLFVKLVFQKQNICNTSTTISAWQNLFI